MDLLDKLKMIRDEINLLIDSEERKRGTQSTVGKDFQQRLKDGMEMKGGIVNERREQLGFEDETGNGISCFEVLRKRFVTEKEKIY